MTRARAFVAVLMLTTGGSPAFAQPVGDLRAEFDRFVGNVTARLKPGATTEQVTDFLLQGDLRPRLVLLAGAAVEFGHMIAEAEEARVDEQLGSTPSSGGTTSMVSKGGIPSVLALAVENGALAQSVSGTTVTFRGTPVGLVSAFQGKGFTELLPEDDIPSMLLSRVSFSVSFDTSRGVTEGDAPSLSGDAQQLSQWSVRAVLLNQRNPSRLAYQNLWTRVAMSAGELGAAVNATREITNNDPAFQVWLKETAAELANATPAQGAAIDADVVRRILTRRFVALSDAPSTTKAGLRNVALSLASLMSERSRALEQIAKGALVTLEYTNDRPVAESTLSNVRLIAEAGGRMDLTGNASITWFNGTPPPGSGRVRDFQLAAQLDMPLTRYSELGNFVLAVAGRYERLRADPILAVAGSEDAANIALAQVKLTIPMKGSGVRIPISLTFASRTELIDERVVRGNVGITYDLDALFARVRPH